MLTRINPALALANCVSTPFRVVGRPDADAIARLKPQREETGGERVDVLLELGIAPANALLDDDQRVVVRPALDDAVEMHP